MAHKTGFFTNLFASGGLISPLEIIESIRVVEERDVDGGPLAEAPYVGIDTSFLEVLDKKRHDLRHADRLLVADINDLLRRLEDNRHALKGVESAMQAMIDPKEKINRQLGLAKSTVGSHKIGEQAKIVTEPYHTGGFTDGKGNGRGPIYASKPMSEADIRREDAADRVHHMTEEERVEESLRQSEFLAQKNPDIFRNAAKGSGHIGSEARFAV